MPRTCIICGVAANSGEHIFPAALGGRRVNRGIYCGTHNNDFSGLAGVLSRQFEMVNALLGVRPDHADRPRILNLTTPAGDEFIVSTGSITRASSSPVDPGEGIHLQFTLGGPEGLPAIGYVALTFFAHHFGDAARQAGLAPIKAFIQGQGENEFVWWESEDTTRGLPPNPFEFGHTIILTTSAVTGEARALISLFQSLTLGVALGNVAGATERTVTVFIDPHADHPPVDTQQRSNDAIDVQIIKPEPMHLHLERIVREGGAEGLLQALFTKIERWRFRTEMTPVLESLNATMGQPINERVRSIHQIVEEQASRVYRLMSYIVKDFRKRTEGQVEILPMLNLLNTLIALNENRDGLSATAQMSFNRAANAIVVELGTKLSRGPIDMDYLWLLFSGGPGAHLVAQTMFAPIMAFLGDPQNWAPEPPTI